MLLIGVGFLLLDTLAERSCAGVFTIVLSVLAALLSTLSVRGRLCRAGPNISGGLHTNADHDPAGAREGYRVLSG